MDLAELQLFSVPVYRVHTVAQDQAGAVVLEGHQRSTLRVAANAGDAAQELHNAMTLNSDTPPGGGEAGLAAEHCKRSFLIRQHQSAVICSSCLDAPSVDDQGPGLRGRNTPSAGEAGGAAGEGGFSVMFNRNTAGGFACTGVGGQGAAALEQGRPAVRHPNGGAFFRGNREGAAPQLQPGIVAADQNGVGVLRRRFCGVHRHLAAVQDDLCAAVHQEGRAAGLLVIDRSG